MRGDDETAKWWMERRDGELGGPVGAVGAVGAVTGADDSDGQGNFDQPDETDSPEKALLVPTDDRYGVTEVYSPPNNAKAAME